VEIKGMQFENYKRLQRLSFAPETQLDILITWSEQN
jgi:hypothetical protein